VDPFGPLVQTLHDRSVRFVLVGVAGANYYAPTGSVVFATVDRDLFVPPDPDNLLRCWAACEAAGLELWSEGEPLDVPRDLWLAQRVVERQALTRASGAGLVVDVTLVMSAFDFETVWKERRLFKLGDMDIRVARLLHIVELRVATGRDKDRLFLAAHREALEELLKREEQT
jgi:hypothetical protein